MVRVLPVALVQLPISQPASHQGVAVPRRLGPAQTGVCPEALPIQVVQFKQIHLVLSMGKQLPIAIVWWPTRLLQSLMDLVAIVKFATVPMGCLVELIQILRVQLAPEPVVPLMVV